jgi:hypothetical protein
MQDSQTLKVEIISALDFLPAHSLKLLAQFVAFLRANTAQEEMEQINFEYITSIPPHSSRIVSPRLLHRAQAADFKKEMVEIVADGIL